MRKSLFQTMFLIVLVMVMFMAPASAKSLFYAANPSSIAVSSGDPLNAGAALVTGQSNVQSITVSGPELAAGDYILVYDAASATGTPKADITVGTAKGTIVVNLNDANFGTGVFATASTRTAHIAVEYTQ